MSVEILRVPRPCRLVGNGRVQRTGKVWREYPPAQRAHDIPIGIHERYIEPRADFGRRRCLRELPLLGRHAMP
jgi:hypothetical protein